MGFITVRSSGLFPKHLMEKFGMIRYAAPDGKTKILIEYDPATGEGWIHSFTEYEEPTLTRLQRESMKKAQSEEKPLPQVHPTQTDL